ncbi:HD-5 [Ecytonucleospora hepatopenaei]|uniref:HD-5 n=1 Tax=Ecytonucleospora hepatopenaei TaxID=646526 RepID=A0A1W0E5Z7_9MICR|nr:HD-5 [Ecytonucleospora hepatopenaei]
MIDGKKHKKASLTGRPFIDNTQDVIDALTVPSKRKRLKLSTSQIDLLEFNFQKDPKPSAKTKKFLSQSLKIPLKNIQTWFQNRRAKAKHSGEIARPIHQEMIQNKIQPTFSQDFISNPPLECQSTASMDPFNCKSYTPNNLICNFNEWENVNSAQNFLHLNMKPYTDVTNNTGEFSHLTNSQEKALQEMQPTIDGLLQMGKRFFL